MTTSSIDPQIRLRAACERAGSAIRWADAVGIDRSYVYRALNGAVPIGPKILRALGLAQERRVVETKRNGRA